MISILDLPIFKWIYINFTKDSRNLLVVDYTVYTDRHTYTILSSYHVTLYLNGYPTIITLY